MIQKLTNLTSTLVLTLFLTLASISPLRAEKLDLSIKYLGITAVKVQINDNGDFINTRAKSVGLAGIAAHMDNRYISNYSGQYLTTQYTKYISQKSYQEERETLYLRTEEQALRRDFLAEGQQEKYPINAESRDFFSALFYLRYLPEIDSGYLWLDANKIIWKAKYRLLRKETINSKIGKKNALVVELSFEKFSKQPKENTDMLTNNLVDEEKSLIFWFSDDAERIPLMAKFTLKPFSVIWELQSYEK